MDFSIPYPKVATWVTYILDIPHWDNGPLVNAGAVSLGNGWAGTHGAVSAANSVLGATESLFALSFEFNDAHRYLIVGRTAENSLTVAAYTFNRMVLSLFARLED